jgi:hypothetical protein
MSSKMLDDMPGRRLISKRQATRRYGDKSLRTIERWVKDGVLPPPDRIINGRWYWYQATLDVCDRQATIETARLFPQKPPLSRPRPVTILEDP